MATKASNTKAAPKAATTTAKKASKYNPHAGYYVSTFLRRAVKFAWRGITYRTSSLSEKELENLAKDEKFPHIRKIKKAE